MSKYWTRIAATLLLIGLALPANATEYGAWKLIDTKITKQFVPDATAPTDRFGKWDLIDVQYSKVFLPDVALAPVNRYGQWQLADVTFDRQWLADQFIRTDELGSSEVGRNLVSDDVEKSKVLKDSGKKMFGDPIEKLLNPAQKEVILGQYKRRDSGRPVSTLVEQYRIDTTYDKQVSHPWTQIFTYAETEKHTRTYDVTFDQKMRLVFKDPITGQQSEEYSFATDKRKDVRTTGFEENGKLLSVKDSGVVVDPLFKVTQEGSVRERELGKKAESASAAAVASSSSARAISSGNLIYGSGPARIGYSGMQERKQLGIDSIKLSQTKSKDTKAVSDSKSLKIGHATYKVTFNLNTETKVGMLGGYVEVEGNRTKVPDTSLQLGTLPQPGQSQVIYTGQNLVVSLKNHNGKYEIEVEARDNDHDHDNHGNHGNNDNHGNHGGH